MSNVFSNVFSELISVYSTWPALKSYLSSPEGGNLRIDDRSTPENPFALLRYIKGSSNLALPHVRAFRSVVWDTLEHRPVSVTPFKSADGEGLPTTGLPADYVLEYFPDGTLIGMWFDKYNSRWRIHTRSTIDANCCYYNNTSSFATMFTAAAANYNMELNRDDCYSIVLMHPDNRIVVPVKAPELRWVQSVFVAPNGVLAWQSFTTTTPNPVTPITGMTTWTDVLIRLNDWNKRFGHTIQGIHIKGPNGQRWKIRTPEYNRIRALRGNTARRDYLWLTAWRGGNLAQYLKVYPEERTAANRIIDTWKRITGDVYHTYVDVFKARSLPKTAIPPKLRSLIYGIHNKFMTELKPQGKSVDWHATMEFMNSRDVPLMLFVLNWENRNAMIQLGIQQIPLEPPSSMTTTVVVERVEAHDDAPVVERVEAAVPVVERVDADVPPPVAALPPPGPMLTRALSMY